MEELNELLELKKMKEEIAHKVFNTKCDYLNKMFDLYMHNEFTWEEFIKNTIRDLDTLF